MMVEVRSGVIAWPPACAARKHPAPSACPEDTFDDHVEERYEEDPQRGGEDGAAEHAGTDGILATGARAGSRCERQHAEAESQRGHEDGAKSHAHRLERRLDEFLALFHLRLGEFHDQDRVLRRQADGGEQADLEVDVVGQPAAGGGDDRAEHPSGTTSMTAKGIDQLS